MVFKHRLVELTEHGKNSPHRGELENADIVCNEDNPSCGDQVILAASVADGCFKEIRVMGHGCIVSQASASLLAEFLEGKALDEVLSLDAADVVRLLGLELGPTRMRCATLALFAMQRKVRKFLNKVDEVEEEES